MKTKNTLCCGQQYDHLISLFLRTVQFMTCIVTLLVIASSFKATKLTFLTTNGHSQEVSVYYGGPAVSFVLIVSFTACLYDAFLLLLVLTLRCATIPPPWSFGIDAVFTMLFMSAGCALAASDYVRYCHVLTGIVHCALLASGAALCFMAFVGFLMSVAWGAWMRNTWVVTPQKKDSLHQTESIRSGLPSELVLGDVEYDQELGATTYKTYTQTSF